MIFLSLLCLSVFLVLEIRLYLPGFYVFDVGQGDSILIKDHAGHNILIDGGPDNKVIYKLGKYLPYTNHQIDLLVLTHPHADHLIGLLKVLDRFEVKKIILTGVEYDFREYEIFKELILNNNISYLIIDSEGIISLDNDFSLVVLYPDRSLFAQKVKNLNNTSIVLKLINNDYSILLMGDFEDEEKLVKTPNLKSDILKVGHHGSITANSLVFLESVDPDYSVISCGLENKFNHPDSEAMANLEKIQSSVWRTDRQGDFAIIFKDLKKN